MSADKEPTAPDQLDSAAGDAASAAKPTGIMAEFLDFVVNNKIWWMTPIIVVLLLMVAFILFAENSPVLPFIYTVI